MPGLPAATQTRADPTDHTKAIEYLLAHAGDLSQEETVPNFSYQGQDLTQLVRRIQSLVQIFNANQRRSKKIAQAMGKRLKQLKQVIKNTAIFKHCLKEQLVMGTT